MTKKQDDDCLWTQDGKYMIIVNFGAERIGRYVVEADTYGQAIKKIVDDMLEHWPDAFDGDSEIKFTREIYGLLD